MLSINGRSGWRMMRSETTMQCHFAPLNVILSDHKAKQTWTSPEISTFWSTMFKWFNSSIGEASLHAVLKCLPVSIACWIVLHPWIIHSFMTILHWFTNMLPLSFWLTSLLHWQRSTVFKCFEDCNVTHAVVTNLHLQNDFHLLIFNSNLTLFYWRECCKCWISSFKIIYAMTTDCCSDMLFHVSHMSPQTFVHATAWKRLLQIWFVETRIAILCCLSVCTHCNDLKSPQRTDQNTEWDILPSWCDPQCECTMQTNNKENGELKSFQCSKFVLICFLFFLCFVCMIVIGHTTNRKEQLSLWWTLLHFAISCTCFQSVDDSDSFAVCQDPTMTAAVVSNWACHQWWLEQLAQLWVAVVLQPQPL